MKLELSVQRKVCPPLKQLEPWPVDTLALAKSNRIPSPHTDSGAAWAWNVYSVCELSWSLISAIDDAKRATSSVCYGIAAVRLLVTLVAAIFFGKTKIAEGREKRSQDTANRSDQG